VAKRRRRRSSANRPWKLYGVLIGLLVLWTILLAAVRHWTITLVLLAIVAAFVYYRHRGRSAAQQRAALHEEKEWEANRQAWRELTFDAGPYSVIVSGFEDVTAQEDVTDFLCDIPHWRDQAVEEVEALAQRIVHIAPQPVAEGVTQANAIYVKEALESRGAKVKIRETTARNGSGRREAISAAVRREVWQRDGGQCVDCGSRERLEYDHIIAVANGGSNTARNLELRCEKCNRSKGANV